MKKILVAEDEQNIREFVVINLERAGYFAVEAETGDQALELYAQDPEGFDVAVLEKTEELKAVYPGEKAYRKAVLSVLGRYKAFEAELSIDGGETTHEACTIVEIANGQCIGGGMRVAPDAKLDDGYFDVVVVKKVPRLLIPLLLPMFMMGWHTKIGLARVTRAKTVTMRAKNMTVNLDGKLLRVDEAHYELLPGAVRMKKPRL